MILEKIIFKGYYLDNNIFTFISGISQPTCLNYPGLIVKYLIYIALFLLLFWLLTKLYRNKRLAYNFLRLFQLISRYVSPYILLRLLLRLLKRLKWLWDLNHTQLATHGTVTTLGKNTKSCYYLFWHDNFVRCQRIISNPYTAWIDFFSITSSAFPWPQSCWL